jgi:hypothetical protein
MGDRQRAIASCNRCLCTVRAACLTKSLSQTEFETNLHERTNTTPALSSFPGFARSRVQVDDGVERGRLLVVQPLHSLTTAKTRSRSLGGRNYQILLLIVDHGVANSQTRPTTWQWRFTPQNSQPLNPDMPM